MPITLACPSCKKSLAVADGQAGVTVACPACKTHLRVPPAPATPPEAVPVPWFYLLSGKRHGPVSEADLERLASSGQLQPTDLIWKQGMAGWVPASTVDGILPPTAPAPPAEPVTTSWGTFLWAVGKAVAFRGTKFLLNLVSGGLVGELLDVAEDVRNELQRKAG